MLGYPRTRGLKSELILQVILIEQRAGVFIAFKKSCVSTLMMCRILIVCIVSSAVNLKVGGDFAA